MALGARDAAGLAVVTGREEELGRGRVTMGDLNRGWHPFCSGVPGRYSVGQPCAWSRAGYHRWWSLWGRSGSFFLESSLPINRSTRASREGDIEIAPRCCTPGLDRSANAHRFLPSAGTSQVHLPLPGPACSGRITRRVGYRITITVRKGLGIGFSLVVGR